MRLCVSLLGFSLVLIAACHRVDEPSDNRQPSATAAPSASVATIGVTLAACSDAGGCERDCNAGSADQCRLLAAAYGMGQGVAKDEARAAALYAKSCELQDAPGCVFAGQMNEYAHGVPKDFAAAAHFYQRSCDLGWPAGCYNMAIMLEIGRGVQRDPAKAADLYDVACKAGAKPACLKATELRAPPVHPQ